VSARGEDREVRGTLVDVDLRERAVLMEQESGKQYEYTFTTNSRVHDGKGFSAAWFRDSRLKEGVAVQLVLPEKGAVIKQLHLMPTAGRPEAPGGVARRGQTPPAKPATSGFGSAIGADGVLGKVAEDKARPDQAKRDDEKKNVGAAARIARIDKENHTVDFTLEQDKQKVTYTLEAKVEFMGPLGGIVEDGVDDDRFIVGSVVRLEKDANGDKLVRIHLPSRQRPAGKK
jgi:hypothetical protein